MENFKSISYEASFEMPNLFTESDLPPIFVPPAMLVQQGQGVEQQAAQSPGPAAYSAASCEA